MTAATAPDTPPAAAPLDAVRALLRRQVPAFALFSLAVTLLLLVPTLYMLQVYDRVLASRNETTLLLLSLLVLGLYGVLSALEWVRSSLSARLAAQADRLLAPQVFHAALQPAPGAALRAQSLAADLGTLRLALAGPLPALAFDLPLALVFLAAAWVVDPVLGLAVAGAIGALVGLAVWQERRIRSGAQAAEQQARRASAALGELARQGETARTLGMQGALLQRWLGLHRQAAGLHLATAANTGTTGAVLRFARLTTQSMALGLGAWLVLEARITPGMMVAASVLLGRALTPVEGLIGQSRQLVALRASWGRLATALAQPEAAAPLALPAARGHLQAEGLGLNAGDAELLHGIQIDLPPGQTLAIVGASGAGKSSLARVLAGALPASAGTVRLDGAALDQWPAAQRGAAIGLLPQDVQLFDGSVAENIARMATVDGTEASAAVVQAAQRAGVHDMVLRLPQGYQTPVGPAGLPLSGGQRQRIGLARALYGQPALLVLDEPDAHLDEAGDRALAEALRGHTQAGGAAVLVTHRPALLARVDQVLVLQAGRALAQGPRDAVLRPRQPAAVPRSA